MKNKKFSRDTSLTNGISPFLKDRALAATAEGITISDAILPDQPILYVNGGFERLTGYSKAEIVGKNGRFLQGKDTAPETVQQIADAISGDRPCSVEILNHRKDGTPFWNRLSITPVKNEDGITTHFIGIQSDITERKNAEDKLEETNRQLEGINRKMKEDLEAAARIQQAMLPKHPPEFPGFNFAWYCRPFDELAGDTLGIQHLDENHVGVYSLDVSGHGVPSALLSATLNHWLSPKPDQETVLESGSGNQGKYPVAPERLAERLNRLFPMDLEHPQYFTLGYGVLDIEKSMLTFVSAGHPPAILVKNHGKIQRLESGGPPVGLLAESRFTPEKIHLDPGDRIFIYTDGLTEAFNQDGEEMGFDRFSRIISDTRNLELKESIAAVINFLEEWTGGNKPEDDISVVALEKSSC